MGLLLLILCNSHVFRRGEAGRTLEGTDEATARTESNALRDGLDGEVAIALEVVDALAGLLDAALAQQDTDWLLGHGGCGAGRIFQVAELYFHAGIRLKQRHGTDHRLQLRRTEAGAYP